MRKIRKGIFETNSSSTHSICIAKDVEVKFPESVYFKLGQFGWEVDTLRSTEEKASYLYTALMQLKRYDDIENIKNILINKGVKVIFKNPVPETSDEQTEISYVDHVYNLQPFLEKVCNDEKKLISYLFSDLSFILTGNDNQNDVDVSIKVDYPHYQYYKGN